MCHRQCFIFFKIIIILNFYFFWQTFDPASSQYLYSGDLAFRARALVKHNKNIKSEYMLAFVFEFSVTMQKKPYILLWTWFVKLGSNSGSLRKKLWQQDPPSVTLFFCNISKVMKIAKPILFSKYLSLVVSTYVLAGILDSQKENERILELISHGELDRSGKWMGFQSKRRKSHIKGQRSTFILDHRKLEYM